MRVRNLRRGLALLAVLGTVMLFLFPVASGPYPATQGPVTALRAMRQCSVLRLSIVLAGLGLLRIGTYKFLLAFHGGTSPLEVSQLGIFHPLQNSFGLRC
jgi:hypothetical protein